MTPPKKKCESLSRSSHSMVHPRSCRHIEETWHFAGHCAHQLSYRTQSNPGALHTSTTFWRLKNMSPQITTPILIPRYPYTTVANMHCFRQADPEPACFAHAALEQVVGNLASLQAWTAFRLRLGTAPTRYERKNSHGT